MLIVQHCIVNDNQFQLFRVLSIRYATAQAQVILPMAPPRTQTCGSKYTHQTQPALKRTVSFSPTRVDDPRAEYVPWIILVRASQAAALPAPPDSLAEVSGRRMHPQARALRTDVRSSSRRTGLVR